MNTTLQMNYAVYIKGEVETLLMKKYRYNVREQNAREVLEGTANYLGVKQKIDTAFESHCRLPILHTFPLLIAVTNPKWENL